MDNETAGTRTTIGYSLGLAGAVAFAVSSFLPFYSVGPGGVYQQSLYRDFTGGASSVSIAGAWLLLFGGVIIIALLAFAGLPASSPRPRPVAFVAAAGTWAVTWIGLLLMVTRNAYSFKVGYWCMLLSVAVILGGSVAIASSRRHVQAASQGRDAITP